MSFALRGSSFEFIMCGLFFASTLTGSNFFTVYFMQSHTVAYLYPTPALTVAIVQIR